MIKTIPVWNLTDTETVEMLEGSKAYDIIYEKAIADLVGEIVRQLITERVKTDRVTVNRIKAEVMGKVKGFDTEWIATEIVNMDLVARVENAIERRTNG